jgi:DNA replication protein DnaC
MVERVDWHARLGKLKLAQEAIAAAPAPAAEWCPELAEGDELGAGPDLQQALESRWSWICPERFVNARVGDIADGATRAKLLEFVGRPDGRTLALGGEVGCGKTYAALAAAHALHMVSREVRFFPVVELWRKLRPGGEDDLIDAVVDVDVLILDDLGSERATEWSAEQLWEIVNRRWLDKRSTIVTSNLPWLILKEGISPRVYDRLFNVDTVRIVLEGGSRRRSG